MRQGIVIFIGVLLLSWSTIVQSAEKADYPVLLAQNRDRLEETAAQVGNYPDALAAIAIGRASLKKAEQAYDKGQKWMGLGSLKPEAEQEVRHNLEMVDLAVTLAVSRAAKGKNTEDTAAVEKQLELVKNRVKLLDERKQGEDKLRKELQKSEAIAKELASVKESHGTVSGQLEQVRAENKKLQEQLAVLTAEKGALAQELEKFKQVVAAPPAPASPVPAPLPPAAPQPAAAPVGSP